MTKQAPSGPTFILQGEFAEFSLGVPWAKQGHGRRPETAGADTHRRFSGELLKKQNKTHGPWPGETAQRG